VPELPEVEHLRRTLTKRIVGRRFESVAVRRREVITTERDPPGGFSRDQSGAAPSRLFTRELLAGDRVATLKRLGKQLAIIGESGRVVCVHLGMTGQLVVIDHNADIGAHAHVVWTVDNGTIMVFRDARRFGGVWTYLHEQSLRETRWNTLGPDALHVTGDELRSVLHRSSRSIKSALLDQHVVAGVGNIYADEALFDACVRPTRRCAAIRAAEFERIGGCVRATLARAVTRGGSSIRDYVDSEGRAGRGQLDHAVYGRGGLACVRCGEPLESGVVASRTTVWCRGCQR